jgi:SAM-dependent methyltransferase
MKINYVHTENIHNTIAAQEILPLIFDIIKPETVVDFGCGVGSWLKIAKQLGAKKILGIDGIRVEKTMLCIKEDEFLQHDLTNHLLLENKYDLGICLEVVEHLPEKTANNIVNILTNCSNIILFSAAIPGQDGQCHVNEQWPSYWQNKFALKDFLPVDNLRQKFWDNPKIEWWYKQNIFLYVNKNSLEALNMKGVDKLLVYIHPEQFNLKVKMLDTAEKHINYLENIIYTEIQQPCFFPTLKRLIKSLIK